MTDNPRNRIEQNSVWTTLRQWFDSEAQTTASGPPASPYTVDWLRAVPLILVHLMCLLVFWVGVSPTALVVAAVLYLVRMFAITGIYHRYFSHRTYKVNRVWQFVFALAGSSAMQRGPLWWAAHHRHHHRCADQPDDPHSPVQHGFWWSHVGWILSPANFPTRWPYVKDWARFPELRWLNRWDILMPLVLAAFLYGLGELLAAVAPGLRTNGPQLLIWGFAVSTIVLLHATMTINSIDHLIGTRRYDTPDHSRNNALLALITLGEGWHNNHHHYPISARQGFFWWEVDITYYILRLMVLLGIVSDLRPLPANVRNGRKSGRPSAMGAEEQGR
ncbi:acyl-CoA desaturase [Desulfatitalea alkaliphila]|uniref:Acyl-CoA desaturase n=1 Tax=Desulfatitalea alkaliphila TaxID=2929485 RepID=A0AA41R718_9BACT|nr:acyl-CoA desaturase [Desulfatitalea alkaliphila]MCJ8502881.1 acyl-CoA desaturase [Desulfatitalea alkaliphila]